MSPTSKLWSNWDTSDSVGDCAELLSERHTVIGIGRRQERLDELTELSTNLPGEFHALSVDLRDQAQLTESFEQLLFRFPGINVLVNNAGLGHRASLIDGDPTHWQEMLQVNVMALCICTQLVVRHLRANSDRGQIIHISSMSAHRVPPNSGMYAASKHAVRALTEALRQELRELGSAIKVTSLSPGFVETEFAEHYHRSSEKAKEIYSRYPVMQAEDIAEQVRFVLELPERVEVHDMLTRPTQQPN